MKRMVRFTKMHGAGNDYIYVNTLLYNIEEPEKLACRWSDRHKGIGADGLVLIGRSPIPEADFTMRIFNADGSEAMMCGNASRCVGKYVYDKGLTASKEIRLLTPSGIKTISLNDHAGNIDAATVDMGEPLFENPNQFLPHGAGLMEGVFVSMGNPHCVIFRDGVEDMDIRAEGERFEKSLLFPEGVNTEFVRVLGGNELQMRVWERGSGETFACGTGACAAAVAAVLCGFCGKGEDITVHLLGGDLTINYTDERVMMTGPAVKVCDGCVEE